MGHSVKSTGGRGPWPWWRRQSHYDRELADKFAAWKINPENGYWERILPDEQVRAAVVTGLDVYLSTNDVGPHLIDVESGVVLAVPPNPITGESSSQPPFLAGRAEEIISAKEHQKPTVPQQRSSGASHS